MKKTETFFQMGRNGPRQARAFYDMIYSRKIGQCLVGDTAYEVFSALKEEKCMLFSSEQVSTGHPDKICDQISDAILADCLSNDRHSRVAVETLIKDNHVTVAGEITSEHEPDVHELVRRVLAVREPGIRDDFDLAVHISKQSPDIAQGVDKKGAGDQGMMFGYATDETHRMLPIPFVLATEAIQSLQQGDYPQLLPDEKSQVTYD